MSDVKRIFEENKNALMRGEFTWVMDYVPSQIQQILEVLQGAGVEPFDGMPSLKTGPFDSEFLAREIYDIYRDWIGGEFVGGWDPEGGLPIDELEAYARAFKALGFKVYRCSTGYWGGHDILIHSPKRILADILRDSVWEGCHEKDFTEI